MRNSEQNSLGPNSEIKRVILFPSYYDLPNLVKLIEEIVVDLTLTDAILILDDSSIEHFQQNQPRFSEITLNTGVQITFSRAELKSGRGGAVFRGMKYSEKNFPALEYVVEADSDGSHQGQDILKVLNFPKADFLIGSRYLPDSRIEGWPLSRRVLSLILNKVIPRLLGIECTDITNGLRRYSVRVIRTLSSAGQSHTGFIYLSEQALICQKSGFQVKEIPIHFLNRELGNSTVGPSEIFNALYGLLLIVKSKSK